MFCGFLNPIFNLQTIYVRIMAKDELLEKELLLEDFLDAFEDGFIEEAEDISDEFIELYPEDAQGYFYMGRLQQVKGDWEEALHFLSKAVALAPDQPQYIEELANAHLQIDEVPEALDQLHQLVDEFQSI